MRVLTVTEHERIWYGAETGRNAGRAQIGPDDLRRLAAFDERMARGEEAQQLFSWGRNWATARSRVGVVQVGGLCVEILPKLERPTLEQGEDEAQRSRKNLLTMLMFAGKVKMLPREIAAQFFARAPLSEAIALLFAYDLREQLLLGAHQGYVTREENRAMLKGKLVWPRHLLKNVARQDRFYVRYAEFMPDTPLNRVLRGVCVMLLEQLRSRACQDMLGQCVAMLDDVTPLVPTLADAERVRLDRQSERFAQALSTCRMILAQQTPAARAGRSDGLSLMFEMNQLYELFVAGLLRREVLPQLGSGYTLHTQGGPHRKNLLTREGDDGKGTAQLKPDLVVEGGGERVILDTKWKRLDPEAARAGVSMADIYQMLTYGHCLDARRIVLLYPERPEQDVTPGAYTSIVHLKETKDPVRLLVHLLPVSFDLSNREARDKQLVKPLIALLKGT